MITQVHKHHKNNNIAFVYLKNIYYFYLRFNGHFRTKIYVCISIKITYSLVFTFYAKYESVRYQKMNINFLKIQGIGLYGAFHLSR